MTQQSAKALRQRKFLLVAPMLVIPFLVMLFWSMGGGKGSGKEKKPVQQNGLNMTLPDPKLKDERQEDKMAFYDEAALDSVKHSARLQSDSMLGRILRKSAPDSTGDDDVMLPPSYEHADRADKNAQRAYSKINELKKLISQGEEPRIPQGREGEQEEQAGSAQLAALQKELHKAQQEPEKDSELIQLNSMLDKLVAVQHPEVAAKPQDTAKARSQSFVRPVEGDGDRHSNSGLTNAKGSRRNISTAIRASIPEDQTVVTGATIKLQLDGPADIEGVVLPAGSNIYGKVSMNSERMMINIPSIRYEENLFHVTLKVYDEDGLEGIYIPGAISRDAAKESADAGINSMGLTTLDPSVGAQVTAAGVQLAKTALSRKVKLIRASVRAGYHIWLEDGANH